MPETEPRFNYTGHATQGENYNKNLRRKDIAKLARTQLKQIYPSYKFSVRVQEYAGGGSISISILEGPKAFVAPMPSANELCLPTDRYERLVSDQAYWLKQGYHQVNHYYLRDDYIQNNGCLLTPEIMGVLRKVTEIINSYNFDDTDSQLDYFHTNFYFNLEIGKWDMPYKVV
jgi:hypothetical protein